MQNSTINFRVIGKQAESVYFACFILPGDYRLPAGLREARGRAAAGAAKSKTLWGWSGRMWVEAPDGGMRSDLGELLFEIRGSGSRSGYYFVLRNEDFSVEAVQEAGYEQPAIYVQLRARLVWMLGYEVATVYVKEIISEMFGPVNKSLLSRVDLTVDLTGWPVHPTDGARMVTRSKKRETHLNLDLTVDRVYDTAAGFTGFGFSMGNPVSCRIYNKLAELRANKTKTWFYRIWRENGWDGKADVWRIEFQLRREALRELGFTGDAVGDLTKLDGVWRYLTEDWMRYCIPSNSPDRSRWETAPAWKAVQGAIWNRRADVPAVRRAEQRPPEREHLRAMLLGVGSTFAAGYGAQNAEGMTQIFATAIALMNPGEIELILAKKRARLAGLSVVKDEPGKIGPELLEFDALSEKLIGASEY